MVQMLERILFTAGFVVVDERHGLAYPFIGLRLNVNAAFNFFLLGQGIAFLVKLVADLILRLVIHYGSLLLFGIIDAVPIYSYP